MSAFDLAAEIAGWAGTAVVVAAFALASIERLSPTGFYYLLANALGSVGILFNSWVHAAWPSVAVNGLWILIAGFAFARARRTAARPLDPEPHAH